MSKPISKNPELPNDSDEVVNSTGACRVLGVKSRDTLNKLVEEGAIPPPFRYPGSAHRWWRKRVLRESIEKLEREAREEFEARKKALDDLDLTA